MLILLATTMLFSACDKDDDNSVPPVITDLVTAYTGADKNISYIATDDGTRWNLNHTIVTNYADTTLRCYCVYEIKDGKMGVYTLKNIFSNNPRPASSFSEYETSPVKLISIWKSAGYVNMHLGIMTTGNGTHKYGFALDSISDTSVAYFTFLHKKPQEDAESYTEDHYFSMPLTDYENVDSFVMNINTYEGKREFLF